MSDTHLLPAPPHRPRRRFRWLIGVAATVCVMALLAALTVWSARPKWYTYVSKPLRAFPHIVLVIRVPPGWECWDDPYLDDADGIIFTIYRKPLTGFARWWNLHVLRLDMEQSPNESYRIWMRAVAVPIAPVDVSRYGYRGIQATNAPPSIRTYEHPLGAATEVTREDHVWILGLGKVDEHSDCTVITVRRHPKDVIICVCASSSTTTLNAATPVPDRFHSTWNEIVRSIRVVQK